MALTNLKQGFAGRALAAGLAATAAVSPLSYSFADEGRPGVRPTAAAASGIKLVDDAGLAAGHHTRQQGGLAVGVSLGEDSNVTPEQIESILTSDFRKAGVTDPITFFFQQTRNGGTVVAYYYGDGVDGPFNLAEARPEAAETAGHYNWQKERGLLLASLDLES